MESKKGAYLGLIRPDEALWGTWMYMGDLHYVALNGRIFMYKEYAMSQKYHCATLPIFQNRSPL